MARVIGIMFLGAIGLMISGAYDLFIQAGVRSKPTTVSVADLAVSVPANRNLVVTGGRAMTDDAVVFYKTRRNTKVPFSEVCFIPVQEASLAAYRSLKPPLLVRMSELQMDALKKGRRFDANRIRGIRMTHLELENGAEELLAKRYGAAAVERMVILEYEKPVPGALDGIKEIFWGVAWMTGAIVLVGVSNRS